MQLEARKYLYDIQEAAALAAQFTNGVDFGAYHRNPMLRLAVERAFSIIGEALTQLARADAAIVETDHRFPQHHRISEHSYPCLCAGR